MLNTSLSPWPAYSPEEIEAVAEVLRSGRVNYWTGSEGRDFEKEFASWCGSGHGVALANGTVALDVAVRALEIGPGDEVIVTPRTFIASASCVVNAGATPVFADVDPDSGNLSAATVEPLIGPRTRAIIPVHLAGWPCEMEGLMELARGRGIAVIEDCAQAHGARHRGRSVGTFGEIGAWSFCQDKIITTGGEGGMVTTDDPALWSAMWSFKDHGKSWEAVYERAHPPGYRWLHESFGTNWRMLEMQAAIGRIQLRRLEDWVAARGRNAAAMEEVCARHGDIVRAPKPDPRDTHAHYRFYAYVDPDALREGWSRDRIIREMEMRGAPAYQGSCSEVYLEKAFEASPSRPSQRLPVARRLGETSLMLLTHPTIRGEELDRVCTALDDVLRAATR
ncbi:MAG TPA: DegT/DnrJ/EryC1/StrS aminotransferase family protein [Allosphingosinicella sp.]|nr:DegT/DnrJ/EryC1/StrS aminotransferase family protein [Allosphingosinicella sp.]